MKKYALLLLISLSCLAGRAQNEPIVKKGEKLQSLKIAFISRKLELSSEEAQSFWPIYNRYEGDLKSLNTQNRGGDVIEHEEQVLNLRKRYREEFIRVIGQSKMNKLFLAEKEFRTALLRRFRNRLIQQKVQNQDAL